MFKLLLPKRFHNIEHLSLT